MKHFPRYLAAAAMVGAFSTMARAGPKLFVTDGVNSVLISDNHLISTAGVGSNSTLRTVNWAGSIGTGPVDVGFGITHPSVGAPPNPSLDSTFNVTSIGSGTLWFYFANDGFGPTVGSGASPSVGGTAGNAAAYDVDGGNSFSGVATSGLVNNQGPDSLTQGLVITPVVTKNGFGDVLAEVTVPDDGSTLILLGFGLTAMALLRRQRAS